MTKSLDIAVKLLLAMTVAGTVSLSGCGKKGDPVRPGQEKKEQKSS